MYIGFSISGFGVRNYSIDDESQRFQDEGWNLHG